MCYVSVSDVDDVYREFRERLKKAYGKIPVKGFPRITKLNDLVEDRRFNLVDPAGNYLIIGQQHAVPKPIAGGPNEAERTTKFTVAYETAYKLTYSKEDQAQAARVLDLALGKSAEVSAPLRYKAFVLRADIAFSMDDLQLAKRYIGEAGRLPLSAEEREKASAAADRLEELKSSWA